MPAFPSNDELLTVIERHWGFRSLRPLQEQAMHAVLHGRDSLVVLPTGGGKSLCYQAPAVYRGDTTVVISPLIALMKDQVDGLRECGVPAIQIDSSQSAVERFACEREVAESGVRLLFVSPERLVQTGFYRMLQKIDVRSFAIDEAHCISHWGHDFRPEYRQLARLREFFPNASVHAYTATATQRVRQDIIAQLGLRNAEVLVGDFDRPNLIYRVVPRRDLMKQVLEVIARHPGEAGIIYCIRRADVDGLTASLLEKGFKVMPYHAGLTQEQRKATQEAFTNEECDLIVATVAFGMGIDRSNIRFVLHAAMPKSLEHYQQEAGRAGRDGLEAECVLLSSAADTLSWKAIQEKSVERAREENPEVEIDPEFLRSALQHVEDMDRYARGAVCRHRALVGYFGQQFSAENCGACDICLEETEALADGNVVAQKIISCVARMKGRFGVGHLISVLRGEDNDKVRKFRHDQLSTHGILREQSKADLRDWTLQLIGQGALAQEQFTLPDGHQVPLVVLNPASWEVMRGQRSVRLVRIARKEKKTKSVAAAASWEGVDAELFEVLRRLRREIAERERKPPYQVFNDATLQQLAATRPTTSERMRLVSGVGEQKLKNYGERFLQAIRDHSRAHGLSTDVGAKPINPTSVPAPRALSRPNLQRTQAFGLFREGAVVEDVMHTIGRARSTVVDYLCEFIREERPASIAVWVPEPTCQRVAAAARKVGTERLKPVFIALGEAVSYDDIRIVLAHLAPEALSDSAAP